MTTEFRPLLLEIGCEELPPSELSTLASALLGATRSALEHAGLLGPGEGVAWRTPRRLAIRLPAVRAQAPPRRRVVTGPLLTRAYDPQGKPTEALLGFVRAQGVGLDDVDHDGTRVTLTRTEDGCRLAPTLEAALPTILSTLPCSRRMLWDEALPPFPRPIRRLLVLHGPEVVALRLGPLVAGRETRDHRVHDPRAIPLATADDYERVMLDHGIFVVQVDRLEQAREHLLADCLEPALETLETPEDFSAPLRIEKDEELIDENLGLLEHPHAIIGRFDPAYLQLPEEVIRTVLRTKQRAFTIRDSTGRLVPAFAVLVNHESSNPAHERHGFERVVRPRLADALFFFHRDRSRRLADYASGLDQVALEHGLGTLADRTQRLVSLSLRLVDDNVLSLGEDDEACEQGRQALRRSAELSQCDLLTSLVAEYPELEGIAGGIYARLDGEDETVARALAEHVLPRRMGDALPSSRVGLILSLTTRLELLAGSFARGIVPSGNADPMGLRRAASGLLRILLEGSLDPDLGELFTVALEVHRVDRARIPTIAEQLYGFHLERLASLLESPPDLFRAIVALHPPRVSDIVIRLAVLRDPSIHEGEELRRLIAINKRIVNILRRAGEDVTDTPLSSPPPNEPAASVELAELLARLTADVLSDSRRFTSTESFRRALLAILPIGAPLERFFEEVLVLDPDPSRRAYRLGLLSSLRKSMLRLVSFEHIQASADPA